MEFAEFTHISLLLKGEEACKFKDYRPVSLMHSVAKIVCKMMANRLAQGLQTMIPHIHCVFIKTRSIHDNFAICQKHLGYSLSWTLKWGLIQFPGNT
jgi:hypothetical protein